MIRNTIPADADALMEIIESSDQFDAEGLAHVRGTLFEYLEGDSHDIWLTAIEDSPVGVAYCAPEPVTSGTWNLLMLWTRHDKGHQGYGSALVQHIESELTQRGARLLIVETSGLPEFEAANAFYDKCGFVREATIKDFFDEGDDKIVYSKSLRPAVGAD